MKISRLGLFFIFLSFVHLSYAYGADTFPETVIKTKSSSSPYANGLNAFAAYKGQCTWYAYGRVIELAEAGYLSLSMKTLFHDSFWGKTGRDAKNWPDFLGGSWIPTSSVPLPIDKRRKGLIAVWKGGTHGHVGFVEEVSADKTKYRLTDFNRGNDELYRDKWYDFSGSSDYLLGGYPYFFELTLASQPTDTTKPTINSFSVTPSSVQSGNSFTASYNVSDSGGAGLKQVELWFASDSSGTPVNWSAVKTNAHSGNGPVSGSFTYAPSSAGTYWFGLHAVDNKNNWVSESTPMKVTVTPKNNLPTGWLDSATCDSISGWARDPDTASAIDVHVYANGPSGQGSLVTSAAANNLRSDLPFTDKYHGYSIPTPASLKDGQPHSMYVYAIDSAGGPNPLLSGSPKTITCTPVDAIIPSVAVTSPTAGATYSTSNNLLSIAGSASDNVGVTQLTWSNNRGGSGTCSGTTNWTASGIILQGGTNIISVTAKDAAGNTKAATLTVSLDGYASVSALSVSPSPVILGQNFSANLTLKEIRGAAKTFEQIAIAILKSDGTSLSDMKTYSNVTVPANGTWSQVATNSIFTSNPAGTYQVVVRGKLPGGNWFDFDTTGTGENPVRFTTENVDTAPNPFNFIAQSDVPLNTVATSNGITVSGVNSASPISIAGGSYSINGGAYTSTAGVVVGGDTVTVRLTSSAIHSTTTSATLTIGGVSSTFSVATQLAQFALNVAFAGTGDGSVSGDITCTSGEICAPKEFLSGTNATVWATPNAMSTFKGWSGSCTNLTRNCSVMMDADKSVTATFDVAPKAMVDSKEFSSLQAAYNDIGTQDNTIIRLLGGTLPGHFVANRGVMVSIVGGYDSDYGAICTETAIHGNFRIRAGTVRIRGIHAGAQSASQIPGDLNYDGKVDLFDWNILHSNYGKTDCGNPGDINGDCNVNEADYAILQSNYGNSL